MLPTLSDGDRLLVGYRVHPAPNRLAIVRFADGVVAVKRIDHRAGDGWWVVRDNPVEGRDSFSAGAIAPDDVLGVALARIWPRPTRLSGPSTVGR